MRPERARARMCVCVGWSVEGSGLASGRCWGWRLRVCAHASCCTCSRLPACVLSDCLCVFVCPQARVQPARRQRAQHHFHLRRAQHRRGPRGCAQYLPLYHSTHCCTLYQLLYNSAWLSCCALERRGIPPRAVLPGFSGRADFFVPRRFLSLAPRALSYSLGKDARGPRLGCRRRRCAELGPPAPSWPAPAPAVEATTGALLTLQGAGAYDAAVHCASVSAARRMTSPGPSRTASTMSGERSSRDWEGGPPACRPRSMAGACPTRPV